MRVGALLRLSRWHRPVGAWLLAAPCLTGIVFARFGQRAHISDAALALLFLLGALAMRGAGCTYNDMLDRRLDAQVARTRSRPLAAGEIGLVTAGLWMFIQCLAGLAILMCLPLSARYMALVSLPLVVAYPLMKRLTSLPQFWLGITFNWGVLVAVMAVNDMVRVADVILYLSLAVWTVGYDTIYAMQDADDDRRAGIGSTVLAWGRHASRGVAVCYGLAVSGLMLAVFISGPLRAVWAVLPFATCLVWQLWRLRHTPAGHTGGLFAANTGAILILIAGWAVSG